MRPELRFSSGPIFFRHFSANSAESGGNCRTMVERKCNTGYNLGHERTTANHPNSSWKCGAPQGVAGSSPVPSA